MAVPNEALQKVLQEIERTSIMAAQQIALVRTQQASKQRDVRIAELTRDEISSLPPETKVYEGVGKMFVARPISTLKEKLASQIKESQKEMDGLGKKLQSLEMTQQNSQQHIDRLLGGRASA